MDHELVFPARFFAPLMRCKSSEETRYYLNGAHFRQIADDTAITGRAVVAATTDGSTLFTMRAPNALCSRAAIWNLEPISLSIVKTLAKMDKDPNDPNVWLAIQKSDKSFGNANTRRHAAEILSGTAEQVFVAKEAEVIGFCMTQEIDGTFPAYQRVVPNQHSDLKDGRTPTFMAKYISRFADIATDLGAPGIEFRGGLDMGSPALIGFSGFRNAIGVIMPYRGDGTQLESPAWLNAPDAEPAIEEAKPRTSTKFRPALVDKVAA